MFAYYNEIDSYAAQWLRNLTQAGFIPNGDVDERSIVEVMPDDVRGYTQCHFFAGMGGWPYALRCSGWPETRPIWTGSCPCQPFSAAGKGLGAADPRHLWPHFHRLVSAVRPAVIMGEQVAGKAGHGWFDGICADLDDDGYTSRAVDIPALAVNAPHVRNRLYWLAMGDASGQGLPSPERGAVVGAGRRPEGRTAAEPSSAPCDVADASGKWQQPREQQGHGHDEGLAIGDASRRNGTFWSAAEWLKCADGKSRRTPPGVPLVAHGLPARVPRLRAIGNALCAPLAVEVIRALMDTMPDDRELVE